MQHKRYTTLTLCLLVVFASLACTSMIIGPRASKSGRPLLWKHRDTGTEHNMVERVNRPGQFEYVALFNGGDTALAEAWMGMNERGFAIMNTASYNLAPDTARIKDREGLVMSRALATCVTVDDFRNLLDTLPKPLGVQANFGVIDALGNGAYFETDDFKYTVFSLADAENDVLVRTNYSFTGNDTDGMGYIRYDNACHLTQPNVTAHDFTPATLTEGCSRSFYHSVYGRDMAADGTRWLVDQDFIPRHSSSASVVIEGCQPGGDPKDYVMWTVIGYPPVSHVRPVTIDSVPDDLRPLEPGYRSRACNQAIRDKRRAFPIRRGSGKRYIDMQYLKAKSDAEHKLSVRAYSDAEAARGE